METKVIHTLSEKDAQHADSGLDLMSLNSDSGFHILDLIHASAITPTEMTLGDVSTIDKAMWEYRKLCGWPNVKVEDIE